MSGGFLTYTITVSSEDLTMIRVALKDRADRLAAAGLDDVAAEYAAAAERLSGLTPDTPALSALLLAGQADRSASFPTER